MIRRIGTTLLIGAAMVVNFILIGVGASFADPLPAPPRFTDPSSLICPACGDRVRCEAPGYWKVSWGFPAPQFSHDDATPLCNTPGGLRVMPLGVTP